MVPIPDEPWSSLRADFYGPVHGTGEHILVVQDEYSRYPEIEILSSTGCQSALPALDRILSRFGIPDVLRSDNGPPFNGHEFAEFANYMGFKHRPVTPLAPWANGLVERFMPNLTKLIQIAKEEGMNWRQEAQKYLRAYRATPHPSTGVSPAHALFNGRRYKTRLPSPVTLSAAVDQARVRQCDREAKRKMKDTADRKAYVKANNLQLGDKVLCRQTRQNKTTTAYYRQPMTVVRREGSRITAEVEGRLITRHANFFKAYRTPLGARDVGEELTDVAIRIHGGARGGGRENDADAGEAGEESVGDRECRPAERDDAADVQAAEAVPRPTREEPRVQPNEVPARPRRASRRPGRYRDYDMG